MSRSRSQLPLSATQVLDALHHTATVARWHVSSRLRVHEAPRRLLLRNSPRNNLSVPAGLSECESQVRGQRSCCGGNLTPTASFPPARRPTMTVRWGCWFPERYIQYVMKRRPSSNCLCYLHLWLNHRDLSALKAQTILHFKKWVGGTG